MPEKKSNLVHPNAFSLSWRRVRLERIRYHAKLEHIAGCLISPNSSLVAQANLGLLTPHAATLLCVFSPVVCVRANEQFHLIGGVDTFAYLSECAQDRDVLVVVVDDLDASELRDLICLERIVSGFPLMKFATREIYAERLLQLQTQSDWSASLDRLILGGQRTYSSIARFLGVSCALITKVSRKMRKAGGDSD